MTTAALPGRRATALPMDRRWHRPRIALGSPAVVARALIKHYSDRQLQEIASRIGPPRISEQTAAGLIELFGKNSDMGTAAHWSCSEAEMLAGMLRELGAGEEAASFFLEAHALTDEPDDDHYTGPRDDDNDDDNEMPPILRPGDPPRPPWAVNG